MFEVQNLFTFVITLNLPHREETEAQRGAMTHPGLTEQGTKLESQPQSHSKASLLVIIPGCLLLQEAFLGHSVRRNFSILDVIHIIS